MKNSDLAWSVPVMRVGYAGRGLVYLVFAGFSLYAISRGVQPQGTTSTLGQLETTAGGMIVVVLIFLGSFAFTVWNIVDAAYDLENYGTGGKGIVARVGKIIAAVIYAAIGSVAFSLVFIGRNSGGSSSISRWTAMVMSWAGGRWIVGIIGLIIIGAGVVFVVNGWKQKYRQHLQANQFTMNWNWLLKVGIVARGIVTAIVGMLFVQAALRANPASAGGSEKAFSWLIEQPYGESLVAAICAGLIAFALFSFVNAAYRIVPKVPDQNIETLATRLAAKVKEAT